MDLMEQVGRLESSVKDVMKLAMPKSEAEERFKKIETAFTEVQEGLKEQKIRLSALPGEDVGGGAGHWLAKNGYPSIKAASRMVVYPQDEITGQVVNSPQVPQDVLHALKTMDEVYMVDYLMSRTRKDAWLEEKKASGARETFMKHFPELGNRHDATIKAMAHAQNKSMEEYLGKALTTGGTGTGLEWIPNSFSPTLLPIIRLANPETNLIPHISMPANPWKLPFMDPIGQAYRKIEAANVTESTPTTANKQMDAHVHAVYHALTDELNQDSIVAAVPALRASITRAMAEGIAMAIVNGDIAASHIDVDYQTSSAPFFTYQGGITGLRQFALDPDGTGTACTVDGGANALAFADVGAAIAKMGKFGAGMTSDLALLVNAESWLKLLTEASSPIVTIDKYGSQATILTGEVSRIYGVPIFLSHAVEQRKDSVSSTGKNAGTGDTLSTAVLFNRFNFRIGDRRDFRFETDRSILAMRDDMVASIRLGMIPIEGSVEDDNWNPLGTPAVCAIINID